MVVKRDNPETMTKAEAKERYSDKWFCYVVVEMDDSWSYRSPDDNIAVQILWLGDSKMELASLPIEERRISGFTHIGVDYGLKINPEPGICLGWDEPFWPWNKED